MSEKEIKGLLKVVFTLSDKIDALMGKCREVSLNDDLAKCHRELGEFVYNEINTMYDEISQLDAMIFEAIFGYEWKVDELINDDFLDAYDWENVDNTYNNLIKLREKGM